MAHSPDTSACARAAAIGLRKNKVMSTVHPQQLSSQGSTHSRTASRVACRRIWRQQTLRSDRQRQHPPVIPLPLSGLLGFFASTASERARIAATRKKRLRRSCMAVKSVGAEGACG
jgi:hypothetical protein